MKPIIFLGNSLNVIRAFPSAAPQQAGHQLDRVQHGLDPTDWKPMPTNKTKPFETVWDALEDDPIRMQNLRLRSELMMRIAQELRARDLTQVRAAELLCITQPRVSALMQGKIDQFRLDCLVDFAHRLGMRVAIEVAA